MLFDPAAAAGLVTREVRTGSRDGRPTRMLMFDGITIRRIGDAKTTLVNWAKDPKEKNRKSGEVQFFADTGKPMKKLTWKNGFVKHYTLGYDPQAKKYVGSWVCSMEGYLWKYEGTVDASGKVLTLNTEGPSMSSPGKMAKMKDVLEIKDKDHKVLKSYMQGPDGKWVQFMTINARRK